MDIPVESFGTTLTGQAVEQYTLTNRNGASMKLITYGATMTHLCMPDRNGHLDDVVLGFDTLRQYEMQSPYVGCVVGRVCNRIARGTFELDGVLHRLPLNETDSHLHGGMTGYDKRVWQAEPFASSMGPSVRFILVDPDGSEGYPGTVHATAIYTLGHENVVRVQFFATCDRATPVAMTHHAYFNLKDGGRTPVLDHVLSIHADRYTPTNANLIVDGEVRSVAGTPFDFRVPTPIGSRFSQLTNQPIGYDLNYLLPEASDVLRLAADVFEPTTGRTLQTWTDAPGIQLYTGNFLDGSIHGKGGVPYRQHAGFCLETQSPPNAVNCPNLASCILRPGETYRHIVDYRFSAR